MKKTTLLVMVAAMTLCAQAQKSIYIPQELRPTDLLNDTSTWSYSRMHCTDNFTIMWQKGFGMDLSYPPDLKGKPMHADLKNLEERLENYYAFYRDSLQFVNKGSKSEQYRMLVMVNYSLEGTAYGGDYDGIIGALWVTPGRIQDHKLNCIAHELGHCFQRQITCDGEGEAWGGSGFFEMTSQWMLWQVNPDWVKDESYHFTDFAQRTHKAFLHFENIYHSPYILECWGERHGKPIIAELFRQGRTDEDPAMTYMRINSLTQTQFCDEMYTHVRRMVNMDFPRAWKETRPFAEKISQQLTEQAGGWMRIDAAHCPENYGFNIIRMDLPPEGKTARVKFRGLAGAEGYTALHPEKAGWRYGLVGIDTNGQTIYGPMSSATHGTATLKCPKGRTLCSLYMVVMGAPTEHWRNEGAPAEAQWPYEIKPMP